MDEGEHEYWMSASEKDILMVATAKTKSKKIETIYYLFAKEQNFHQLFISLTHSQTPFKFSFQRVTFPSPQLTANKLPAKLHETRQTTSGNLPAGGGGGAVPTVGDTAAVEGSKAVFTQGEVGVSFVQIITVLS